VELLSTSTYMGYLNCAHFFTGIKLFKRRRHLRSLDGNHTLLAGSIQCYDLHTNCFSNPYIGSAVVKGKWHTRKWYWNSIISCKARVLS